MADFSKLNNFSIEEKPISKYSFKKDSDRWESIAQQKPIFAFDYICDDKSELSFAGTSLGAGDYQKFFKNLKRRSSCTFEELKQDDSAHFHDIKWDDVSVKKSIFDKCILGEKYEQEKDNLGDITPYQLKLFEEARIVGFFYMKVFYAVFFDRGHNMYDGRKNGKKKSKKSR